MRAVTFVCVGFLGALLCRPAAARWMNLYPKVSFCEPVGPTGDPLFLTPYIEAGRAKDGREAARVPPLLDQIESYSGYLTVNKKYKSNLFFWYFPAESDPGNAPVALWLQGGPGASSMFGLFTETGPIQIESELELRRRNYSWSEHVHMIYIDNPVGTGFSFTEDPAGYASTEEQIGRDLYFALLQFFQLFPNLSERDFFITGESYAGKYIPALAYAIHKNNQNSRVRINLKGVAIGNGLVDPENMMKYSDYLFQHGLVDGAGQKLFKHLEDKIVNDIKNRRYLDASVGFQGIFSLLRTVLGRVDAYDYVADDSNMDDKTLSRFFCQCGTRKSIHVGNLSYNDGSIVQHYLANDIMKTVKPWFEEILENYRVLLYNGQLDIVVAYPLTIAFVEKLKWSGTEEYKAAQRKQWMVGNRLAGYSKSAKNFTEILVRDAGHMVPGDQPQWAQEMIRRFFSDTPF